MRARIKFLTYCIRAALPASVDHPEKPLCVPSWIILSQAGSQFDSAFGDIWD